MRRTPFESVKQVEAGTVPSQNFLLNRTIVNLLVVTLAMQIVIGIALVVAVFLGFRWVHNAIEQLNLADLIDIIKHALRTSVNIETLSADALVAVHAASASINETAQLLSSINGALRNPTLQVTLPGFAK